MSANGFCKFTYLKGLHGHRFPKGDGAYRVLVTVLDYADEHGRNAHPGITRLADDSAMGASTIRRHLKWLKERGYIVQESRGHSVGDVNLASVYSLAMPDLPLVTERKVETPTAQSEPPTAHLEQTYRSARADLLLTGEHLSDPLSDPFTSDPFTSNPPDEPDWDEPDDDGWDQAWAHSLEALTEPPAEKKTYRWREWKEIEAAGGVEAYEAMLADRQVKADSGSGPPSSRPDTIVSDEKRCGIALCANPVAPPSTFFCAEHLTAFSVADLKESGYGQARPHPVH